MSQNTLKLEVNLQIKISLYNDVIFQSVKTCLLL